MDLICIKFAQRKYEAKICLLQSKPVANAVNAIFATIFEHWCITYFYIVFVLSKFDVFPFFRPV